MSAHLDRNIWPGERLRTVASLLPSCHTFYDIGSNHGKLPAHLLETGKCQNAVITDISEKSLQKARELFLRKGLTASFFVNDGLCGLSPASGDALSLCGMGAQVILKILESGLPCQAVLQPSVRVELLRNGLPGLGVGILAERLAQEGGRFYVCLSVCPGNGNNRPYSEKEAFIGRLQDDPLYHAYILWRQSVYEKALSGGSTDESLKKRLDWIREEV